MAVTVVPGRERPVDPGKSSEEVVQVDPRGHWLARRVNCEPLESSQKIRKREWKITALDL